MENFLIVFLLLLIPQCIANEISPTIDNLISMAEIKYKLPSGLLKAVITVESNGNVKSLNPNDGTKKHKKAGIKVKSYGLLQIQCDTAKDVGFIGKCKDLMKPELNIEYGAKYLKKLLNDHDNNVAWSLVAYNSGPYSIPAQNKRYTHYVGLVFNAWIKTLE